MSWLEGINEEISKETVKIIQVRENEGLNQAGSNRDGKSVLGHT